MNEYTVVGLMADGSRIAAWVHADTPELAEQVARTGGGIATDDPPYGEELIIAGIFAGHLVALDEQ
jgi:hypothetical protein